MVKKKTNTKHHKRKLNVKNVLVLIISIILVVGIIGAGCGLVIISNMLQSKPELIVENFVSPESSKIYDKDGNLIADVGSQIRENVSYNELPESLIDAFVSIEDSRFFEHNGFDIARFIKSGIEVLKARSFVQGGSTLTMQLVKNTYYVSDETQTAAPKKIERKVQEIALAIDLEDKISKQNILELYLNKINFGGSGGIRGVQKASEYYFGKNVSELNVAECAMLAGIVNAPNAYNPFLHLDYATSRRNTVLYQMYNHGYITSDEYNLFKAIKVEDLLQDPNSQESEQGSQYAYQSYIDEVIKEAQKVTGLDPFSVSMEIYTCMDTKTQKVMDSIQQGDEESILFPDDLMEIGTISINNQTGEIVAIGGGRNYGRGGSMLLNHATEQYKQPGSSVKTILSYALAFEYLGWSTSHVVEDKPMVYAGTDKVIRNANGQYVGQITLKDAVSRSLNTPAIATLQEIFDTIGRDKVVEYLQSLGFSCVKNNPELVDIQYAIGGSNFTVSAKELAAAHSIIMNGGYYIEPHTIKRIEFNNGDAPIEPTYAKTKVLSESTCFLVSELMYDAVYGYNYNYMQILKRDYPVYGKTGTTDWGTSGLQYNIPQGAVKDKWMVAETTHYTTAVWVGYEKGVKDANTYFDASKNALNLPGRINSLILDALNEDDKPAAVTRPEDVVSITHILATYPYARPIEGMDPQYITTGYIQKDNAELVDPETSDVKELTSFNASVDANGTLSINWAKYPDESKLTIADSSIDLSISVGNTYVEAYGTRLFDYTWIFGPIRYKARIMQDGTQVQEIISETESFQGEVQLKPGSHIQVCGYYAYEYLGTASNEICTEFTAVDQTISLTVPTNSASVVDITNWAGGNNINYLEPKKVVDDAKAGQTEVRLNGKNVSGQTISFKQSEQESITIEIIEYIKHEPTQQEKCEASGNIWNNDKCIEKCNDPSKEQDLENGGCKIPPTAEPTNEPTASPEG